MSDGSQATFLCTRSEVAQPVGHGRSRVRIAASDLAAAGCASPLGLLAEQADAHSRELLGNYPQAFSHIGLINSALYLAYAEGRELPLPLPGGEPLHRARG